jgi:predicted kinase
LNLPGNYLAKQQQTLYNQGMKASLTTVAVKSTDNLAPTPIAEGPVLVMVSGLPGTGKSFFSRKLAERLACTILESDEIRKRLFPLPTYSLTESARVFEVINRQMDGLLKQGISVIMDATNLKEKHRKSVYEVAQKNGARLIIVEVNAPPELVKERLKARSTQPDTRNKSDADWAVYQKMKPGAEKISRPHFNVNSARDITLVINKIIKDVGRK